MANKAFVIGVNTQGLKYCSNDAMLVADGLKQCGYEIITIKTPEGKHKILELFDAFVEGCAKTDTAIFYFSGHGLPNRGRLDLIVAEDVTKMSSRIPISVITEAFEGCIAQNKLIIFDCCHAGAGHANWKPDDSEYYRILIASERLEKTNELDELEASFLAHRLHQILTQPAIELLDDDRKLRINTLGDWLVREAEQHNGLDNSIKVPYPSLLGSTRANFGLTAIKDTSVSSPRKIAKQTTQLLLEEEAERRYRELALESCDIIDLANLPEDDRHIATRQLELRRLYVPLKVKVEISAEVEVADSELEALEQRRQKILLGQVKYDELAGKDRLFPVGERLASARRLVILGDPGAGKTTILRWITTAYLLRLKDNIEWQALPDVATLPAEIWLPIIIRCRDLSPEILNGYLEDILHYTLRKAELTRVQAESLYNLLQAKLSTGQALLLIDGLDEIADPTTRIRFCQQIEQMNIAYPQTPMIVTSRIVGYREMGYRLGRGFEHVTVAELSNADKDDFARRWCNIIEPPERQETAFSELIKDIHSTERIERLTGNPMLLTTLALVKRKVGKLPSRRADLYWEAVQVLLNWRSEVDTPLDYREAVPQLEYIAYAMSERGVQQLREDEILDLLQQMRQEYPNIHPIRNHTPDEFLHLLERRTAIMIEAGYIRHKGRPVPVYEFRHSTFQEYLAGLALVDGRFPNRDRSRSLADIIAQLAGQTNKAPGEVTVTDNWREVLRLCVASCNDDEVDRVLQAIATPLSGEDTNETAYPRAALAILCLADEPNVSQETAKAVLQTFAAQIGKIKNSKTVIPTNAVDIVTELAESRWAEMQHLCMIEEFYQVDIQFGTLFAGLMAGMIRSRTAPKDKDSFRDWLRRETEIIKSNQEFESAGAILGIGWLLVTESINPKVKIEKRLVDYLVETLTDNYTVARAASLMLTLLNSQERQGHRWRPSATDLNRFNALVSDSGVDPLVNFMLITILGNERSRQSIELLIARLNNVQNALIRVNIASNLSKLGDLRAVEPLLACLQDKHEDVRRVVASALGDLDDLRAVEPLLACLQDADSSVRRAAVSALADLGDLQAVEPLLACLQDEHEDVRRAAASALGDLDDLRAVEPLLACLQDADSSVRRAAVSALADLGDLQAVEPLLARLQDTDGSVHQAATLALDKLDKAYVLELLLPQLENTDNLVWRTVASTLGKLGDLRAVEPLLARLQDTDNSVRRAAAYALADLGDLRAVEPLLARLQDTDNSVRRAAVSALADLGDLRAVEPLLARLQDTDNSVRQAAASALADLGDLRAVEPLLACLQDAGNSVRRATTYALGKLGDPRAVEPLLARLEDTDDSVHQAAAEALGELGDLRAVEPLLARLEDEHEDVRQAATYTLGKLGDLRAVGPLLRRLEDTDEDVRQAAAEALGKLGDLRAVEPLLVCLQDADNSVRQAAAEALGELGDLRAVEPLLACLQDADNSVRQAAAEALGELGDLRAVEPLLARLEDEHEDVRQAAAEALGKLGDLRAIEPLLRRLEGTKDIQWAVIEALSSLGEASSFQVLHERMLAPDRNSRQNALKGLAATCQHETDRQLLSRDLDMLSPYLDPQQYIHEARIHHAARRLKLSEVEIRQRYEVLAQQFSLKLSWGLAEGSS